MPTIIGESFVGEGAGAAHLNVVLGRRGSPVETAWVGSLASPRMGHVPFLAILKPGLPVKPLTLFVNKAAIEGELHGRLTWGAAQAGVASGVALAVTEGLIPSDDLDDLLCIAAVWVNPAATDEEAIFANNRAATLGAIRAAIAGEPRAADVIAAAGDPANPYFRTGGR